MSIWQNLQENKLTIIALLKIAKEAASKNGIILSFLLSTICKNAKVNRTQVYERIKQIQEVMERTELPSPGRPHKICNDLDDLAKYQKATEIQRKVLQYRLDHPGSYVKHDSSRIEYSDGFIRFTLDLFDEWKGSSEVFCEMIQVPYATFRVWRENDKVKLYKEFTIRNIPDIPDSASNTFRSILEDYSVWEGSPREFFTQEAEKKVVPIHVIQKVLIIGGMISPRQKKGPRYRGSTQKCQPGSILATDGKNVGVKFTGSNTEAKYNWQGIVDQATACHTAVVITDEECAEGVKKAYDDSCDFMGRPPQALIHDNKPVYSDSSLKEKISSKTKLIPVTMGRPENNAVMEGEFGKFEQAVGVITLDDSSLEDLKKSAVSEVVRAYCEGINHAGRAEYDGKSRAQVLKETCHDPKKDLNFIKSLHEDHTRSASERKDSLPTYDASIALLNDGFERFQLTEHDQDNTLRSWLANTFTPEAISQGCAIFGAQYEKGRLQNSMAHRYLIKVIANCQAEIDLRLQEKLLLDFAETQKQTLIVHLEAEYKTLHSLGGDNYTAKELLFLVSEKALFGDLFLQRAFWQKKLKMLLKTQKEYFSAVRRHVRRCFEACWEERFRLMSNLVAWESGLAS